MRMVMFCRSSMRPLDWDWLMREAKENVEYHDFAIPKGSFVVPFLSAEKRNWRTSAVYTPFGGGARFCPGADLARLQIAFFLHYLVTKFRWVQLKDDRASFFPSARLVNGFQIRLFETSDAALAH
ncbi:Abietadienol/abietadienal oxidase [Ananas comosus]|uniref:Abietadienol/abietadienal oxidase n=1 Tax=Ananas comosus TaxID=4615 RepID=A0A199VIR8_ANACO|nr:Abietadienol/abietadienal oxidase [Ananas comosus]